MCKKMESKFYLGFIPECTKLFQHIFIKQMLSLGQMNFLASIFLSLKWNIITLVELFIRTESVFVSPYHSSVCHMVSTQ